MQDVALHLTRMAFMPCERAARKRVIAPVHRFPIFLRCRRLWRQLEMFKGLSRTDRLLQPLRHFSFAAPRVSRRTAIARFLLLCLVARDCCSQVVCADTKLLHTATEIGNHAISLSFVHKPSIPKIIA